VANNFCDTPYNYPPLPGAPVFYPHSLHTPSPNSAGITDLPAARRAMVGYPYNAAGTAFPVFGSGSSNAAMAGPVYRFDAALSSAVKFPRYYDGHLFVFDWARSLVHAVALDNAGMTTSVARFWDPLAPGNAIQNPMDIKVGPDGALYFLNWVGTGYPRNGGQGNLIRLEYIGPPDPVRAGRLSREFPETRLLPPGNGQRIWLPTGIVRVELRDLRGSLVYVYRRDSSAPEWWSPPLSWGRVLRAHFHSN
jgi:hypothetical protein